MNRILIILCTLFPLLGVSQEKHTWESYLDTVIAEVELVKDIEPDSIGSILIFSSIGENGMGEAKGFLIDQNTRRIPRDSTEKIPICTDSASIGFEGTPYSDSLYIIKFKWGKRAKYFTVDTCYLFHRGSSYMAYPLSIYSDDAVRLTSHRWYMGPASTDAREVLEICIGAGRKTKFYYF